MSISVLMPCVQFWVVVYPSDPLVPTDLENASLFFIYHYDDRGGADIAELEHFLGMGAAVFEDMLIRMINRGWVVVDRDGEPRLRLSVQAKAILDGPRMTRATMSSTEEGKRFKVCYDLLGGGFAVIPDAFLSKAAEDARSVPRGASFRDNPNTPYVATCPLDGFARMSGDRTYQNQMRKLRAQKIREALLADRYAAKYLRSNRGSADPYIHVVPPGRVLAVSDVKFYRCRFDVRKGMSTSGVEANVNGSATYEDALPELECTEQRNRSVRKLGAANIEQILENAVFAHDHEEDPRFLKALLGAQSALIKKRKPAPDPIEALASEAMNFGEDSDHEDIMELLAGVEDRIARLVASRLDLKASRPCSQDEVRQSIAELADGTHRSVVVSAPEIRIDSPEIAVEPESALSVFARMETNTHRGTVHVHCVTGYTNRGAEFSDQAALMRISEKLGARQLAGVDRALHHVRSAFVLADRQRLLWLNTSLFGDRPLRGLDLVLESSGPASSFGELRSLLPDSTPLGEAVTEVGSPLPPTLGNSIQDIRRTASRFGIWSDLTDQQKADLVEEFVMQLRAVSDWLADNLDTVDVVSASTIRDRSLRLLGPENDTVPIAIGIGGRMDAQLSLDMLEDISARLNRQFLAGQEQVSTTLVLPAGEEFDRVAAQFTKFAGAESAQVRLVRLKATKGGGRPTSFISTPKVTLMGPDGLAHYLPTAGRAVKGTNVALEFIGSGASELAQGFLRAEWPDVDKVFPAAGNDIRKAAQRWLPVSRIRLDDVQQQAAVDKWFDDGNLGATMAADWLRREAEENAPNWAGSLALAEALQTDADRKYHLCGHALLRALAGLEESGEIERVGALEEFARLADIRNDMLTAAIFADDLQDDSFYCQPLVRKLSFHVSRGSDIVDLTDEELADLEEPSEVVQLLSCLMMMDGRAVGIAPWLLTLDPTKSRSRAAGFTLALAKFVNLEPGRHIDLGHVAKEQEPARLDIAVQKLRSLEERVRLRISDHPAAPVRALSRRLFNMKGSFCSDLFTFVVKDWDELAEEVRPQEIVDLVRVGATNLGVDLVEAVSVHGASVDAKTLAKKYFDAMNVKMQREEGLNAVNLAEGGRTELSTVQNIIDIVLSDVLPAALGQISPQERALGDEARRYLEGPQRTVAPAVMHLEDMLRERIRSASASQYYTAPKWLYPYLAGIRTPDWDRDRALMLRAAFPPQTKLHQVIAWLTAKDRAAGSQDLEAESLDDEWLILLHELLASIQADESPEDAEDPWQALRERLREIIENTTRRLAFATDFVRLPVVASSGETSELQAAIRTTSNALEDLIAHLNEDNLVEAVLLANDLRSGPRRLLNRAWESATDRATRALTSRQLHGEMVPQIESIMGRQANRHDVEVAETCIALAPLLLEPIRLSSDFEIASSAQLEVAPLDPGAKLASIAYRASVGQLDHNEIEAMPASQVAQVVLGAVSDLDDSTLQPIALKDGRRWRISCRHPSIAGFGLGLGSEVEFLLPFDREEEIKLRQEFRAVRSMNDEHRGDTNDTDLDRPGRTGDRTNILLSLYSSEKLPGMLTLRGRWLLKFQGLSPQKRRVAILEDFARQRFSEPRSVAAWWSSKPRNQDQLVRSLLDPYLLSDRRDFGFDDVVTSVRDLCLVFGLYSIRDTMQLRLSPAGVSRISKGLVPLFVSSTSDANARIEQVSRVFGRLLSAHLMPSNAGSD